VLGGWTTVGYVSITISILNTLNGLYRILYFKLFLGIKLSDVPIEVNIFGYQIINIDHPADDVKDNNKNDSDESGFEMVASFDNIISDSYIEISNKEETMISQDNKIANSRIINKKSYENIAEAQLVEINHTNLLCNLSIDQVIYTLIITFISLLILN
jgi:hypothetical protein